MRRLIICADGTWNTADETDRDGRPTPTNVARMARVIAPVDRDGVSQIIYYHDGVGTGRRLDRFFGGAFGEGIDRNICDCYRFITDNYEPGDEIWLFGFSRGAYTVRSLAGLIRNSGVLKPGHRDEFFTEAYELYRNRDPETGPTSSQAQAFRAEHAHDVRIRCIGVWDTVGSLGIPLTILHHLEEEKYEFHDVTLSSWIDVALHALAIDERRKPFAPTLWEQQPGAATADGTPQVLKQVWFPGVHSNVGGGYPDHGLSSIALKWMIEETAALGLGFRQDRVDVIEGIAHAQLFNSMKPFYKAFGPVERVIGMERRDSNTGELIDTHESLHESVFQRIAHEGEPPQFPYLPWNVRDYLERSGHFIRLPQHLQVGFTNHTPA
jgi:uncharacterized protein (DUF2235 family)